MSEIDNNILIAFGRLQKGNEVAAEQRKAIVDKLEKLEKQLSVVPQLVKDMNEVKPVVAEMKAIKQKGIGAMFGIGLAAGGFGYGFSSLIKFLTGNGQ